MFEASFAKDRLKEVLEKTKSRIERHMQMFNKTEVEAKDKAIQDLWEHWSISELLIVFIKNQGIENVIPEKNCSDLKSMLQETLRTTVSLCIEKNITIKSLLKTTSLSKVSVNIPTSMDDFTKKTDEELNKILTFIRTDSFYTRFERAVSENYEGANQCVSIEAYVSQILLEKNLPLLVVRNKSRLKAKSTIASNKINNRNQYSGGVFKGESIRNNYHISLDYLAILRKPKLTSVKLVS